MRRRTALALFVAWLMIVDTAGAIPAGRFRERAERVMFDRALGEEEVKRLAGAR